MTNTPPLYPYPNATTETLTYGISRTYLEDGKLVVIASEGDMRREAVDFWANTVIETYRGWQQGSPLLVLHDLSHKNQGITPYAMRRTEDTLEGLPKDDDFSGRAAILIRDGLVARIGAVLVNRLRKQTHARFEIRFFFGQEAALAWLGELLPTQE